MAETGERDGRSRESTRQILVGGRYLRGALLHSGPATQVYQAADTLMPGRGVVLKMLSVPQGSTEGGTASAARRLTTEIKVLSTVRHPGLPVLLDVIDEPPDRRALVLEYLPGQDLGALADRPMPLSRVLEWGIRLCDLLSWLHVASQPWAHGAIKAEHCMLLSTGRLVLLDWGQAREASAAHQRADVQALATLLYGLLTGRRHPSGPLRPLAAQAAGKADAAQLLWATMAGAPTAPAQAGDLRRRLVEAAQAGAITWGMCPYCQATTPVGALHCGTVAASQPAAPATPAALPAVTVGKPGGRGKANLARRLRAVGRYLDEQGLRRFTLIDAGDHAALRGHSDGTGRLATMPARTVLTMTLSGDDLEAILAEAQRQRSEAPRGRSQRAAGLLGSALFPHGYEDRLRALGTDLDSMGGVTLLTIIETATALIVDFDLIDESGTLATTHRQLALSEQQLAALASRARGQRREGTASSLRALIQREQGRSAGP